MKKGLLSLLLFAFSFNLFSQNPTSDFSISPTGEVCVGDVVTFTDLSITNGGPDIVIWTWSLGQGGNVSDQNPTLSYTTPGNKEIYLTVKNSDGGSDTKGPIIVVVNPNPDSEFSILSNDCEAPIEVTFTNESEACADCTFEWNYGNGSTSIGEAPVNPQSYTSSGTATLTVTNNTTLCSSTFTKEIIVSEFSAGITSPSEVCVGEIFTLEDNSTAGANSWTWDVPGATYQNGTNANSQNPEVSFAADGPVTITLTADNTVNPDCPADDVTFDLTVNPLPIFDFDADIYATCPGGQAVTFTIDPYDDSFTYTVDYGDGSPTLETTGAGGDVFTKDYFEEGIYDVTITVVDGNGCSTTVVKTAFITIEEPQVDFSVDERKGCEIHTATFTDMSSSVDPAGDPIIEWIWTFEGGTPSTFNGENPPSVDFPKGKWDVALEVRTANCSKTVTKSNYIRVGIGVDIDLAVISPNEFCIKEGITDFDATNTLIDGLPYDDPSFDEEDVEWEWQFGPDYAGLDPDPFTPINGQSVEEGFIPSQSMAVDTGWMDVRIKVTYRGCESIEYFDNWVYINPPLSKFTLPDYVCNPALDPSVSNPVNVFVDAQGDHPKLPDNVAPDQDANFTTGSVLGSGDFSGPQYIFTDDIVVTWTWDDPNDASSTVITTTDLNFNQDSFESNSSASHDYTDYGEYTITQHILNNTTGCEDETSLTYFITKVEPDYTFSDDEVCLGDNLQFDASASSTTGPDDQTLTYDWSFEDGNPLTSTIESPSVQFSIVGNSKAVDLTTTNVAGCLAPTDPFDIDVLELPIASTTPDFLTVCANPDGSGQEIEFSNTSSTPNGYPIISELWTFGDGSPSVGPDLDGKVRHTYIVPNNNSAYNVTFDVVDAFGCVGQGTTPVEATWPIPAFDVDTVCNGPFSVSGLSSSVATFIGAPTYAWTGDPTISIPDAADTFVSYDEPTPDEDLMATNSLTLTVTDANNCEAFITKEIVVSLPQAIFTSDSLRLGTSVGGIEGGCPPEAWDFDGNFSQSISDSSVYDWGYNWDFIRVVQGDSTSFSTSDLSESGGTFIPGNYVIKYTFTDGFDCSATIYKDIQVVGPSAAVAYSQSTDSCGQYVEFTVLQDDLDFPIDSLQLHFGDGNSVSGSIDPATNEFTWLHIYTGLGSFNPFVETFGGDGDCPIPYPFNQVVIDSTGILAGLEASISTALIGEQVVFTDQSTSVSSIETWSWEFLEEPPTVINNTDGSDVTHPFSSEGEFDVVLTVMANGCFENDTITITVDGDILIPNVFTPNGTDGVNSRWYVPGSPLEDYELIIFNRWGKKMYEHHGGRSVDNEGQPSWNGRNQSNDKLCQDGTYYYILTGYLLGDTEKENQKKWNGHITLLGGQD